MTEEEWLEKWMAEAPTPTEEWTDDLLELMDLA